MMKGHLHCRPKYQGSRLFAPWRAEFDNSFRQTEKSRGSSKIAHNFEWLIVHANNGIWEKTLKITAIRRMKFSLIGGFKG